MFQLKTEIPKLYNDYVTQLNKNDDERNCPKMNMLGRVGITSDILCTHCIHKIYRKDRATQIVVIMLSVILI